MTEGEGMTRHIADDGTFLLDCPILGAKKGEQLVVEPQ